MTPRFPVLLLYERAPVGLHEAHLQAAPWQAVQRQLVSCGAEGDRTEQVGAARPERLQARAAAASFEPRRSIAIDVCYHVGKGL